MISETLCDTEGWSNRQKLIQIAKILHKAVFTVFWSNAFILGIKHNSSHASNTLATTYQCTKNTLGPLLPTKSSQFHVH